MTGCADIAAVLLAAGAGNRFGGNKLEADLHGDLLGSHAARTVAKIGFGWTIAVHNPEHVLLAKALDRLGYQCVTNDAPERGLSASLALATAVAAGTHARAMLVSLGDMPLVTADHLHALVAASRAHPDIVIASEADGVRSPPVLYPRALWPTLALLTGAAGGRALLKDAFAIPAPAGILLDIDTPGDLATIMGHSRRRKYDKSIL